MGKLKGSMFYTVGSMDKSPDGGVGWRDKINPFLKSLGIIHINPCNKPIDIGQETLENREHREQLLKDGKYDELSKIMKLIRLVDLRCTDKADALIFYLNHDIISCGSWEEVFISNKNKKPIMVFCEQGIKNIPFWLWGTLPFEMFFDNWDNLKQYIINIDNGTDQRHFKRWTFFQYEKLI
jgi:hypothetical protein